MTVLQGEFLSEGAVACSRYTVWVGKILWQMPFGDLNQSSQPGGGHWGLTSTEGGRIVVYAGGLPIFADGVLAGALGISGGTGAQDGDCAHAALVTVLPEV
jgi:uncharacterized protein GlcG (DUF336 family)